MSTISMNLIRILAPLAVLALSSGCGSKSDNPPSTQESRVSDATPVTPVGAVAGSTPESPTSPVGPVIKDPEKDSEKDPSKDLEKYPKETPKEIAVFYDHLAAQKCTNAMTGNFGAQILTPGVYCFASTTQLSGILTLDAQNKTDAVFIFQFANTFTTASDATVQVVNGGSECNVFWQVGDSATLGSNTKLIGNLLALTNVTLSAGSSIKGRVLGQKGALKVESGSLANATCSLSIKVSKDDKAEKAPPPSHSPCTDKEKECHKR